MVNGGSGCLRASARAAHPQQEIDKLYKRLVGVALRQGRVRWVSRVLAVRERGAAAAHPVGGDPVGDEGGYGHVAAGQGRYAVPAARQHEPVQVA